MKINKRLTNAVELLSKLIATPSLSGDEAQTAQIMFEYMEQKGYSPKRSLNNVWAQSHSFDPAKPTLLLNSHHDTVSPSSGYVRDPFTPIIEDGRLYGLGSNDAGASVVALIEAFGELRVIELPYNLVIAITAEEERIGRNGITALWTELPQIDCAIVGEPTSMEAAVGERGLMVLDCLSNGIAGHAAREEGVNAIYNAFTDIEWFRNYSFARISPLMGKVKMSVTQIQAGNQHNIIPDQCRFVVDVRSTDCYSNEEILGLIASQVKCSLTPRSTNLRASSIAQNHPLVQAAKSLGIPTFISPTTSDMTRIPVPCLKIGAGDSARSHTADEFVFIDQIEQAIETYIQLIMSL